MKIAVENKGQQQSLRYVVDVERCCGCKKCIRRCQEDAWQWDAEKGRAYPKRPDDYVRDVVDQIFEKEIRARKKIRNRIAFERAMSYAINNFGATTNLTNIVDYLDNVAGVTVKKQTLSGYLELLHNIDNVIILRWNNLILFSQPFQEQWNNP